MTDVLLDSHFHLLQPDMEYPWITDDLARSLRSHSKSELEDEFAQNNVAGGVVVQALNDVRETKTLLKLAPSNPYILGVVGWLDLTSSSIDEDLARVMEGPGGERLVGIRHQIVDAADPAGPLLPHVMRGLEHVAAAGLTFDLVIHQRDIPIAREVAAALPHLALIVDHLAKPDPHPENMTAWREDLASLAAFPNTTCTLGFSDGGSPTWRVDAQSTRAISPHGASIVRGGQMYVWFRLAGLPPRGNVCASR